MPLSRGCVGDGNSASPSKLVVLSLLSSSFSRLLVEAVLEAIVETGVVLLLVRLLVLSLQLSSVAPTPSG